MPRDAEQLALWPDASFDGNRTRQRSAQRAAADYRTVRRSLPSWAALQAETAYRQHYRCARCDHEIW